MPKPIRFGIQTAPQNTNWSEIAGAWKLIDSLDYDTVWLFDHFFAILSDPSGNCLEGWTALSGLASITSRVELGILVTGNTYRNPAVLAKMGATVDQISNGRLIMGMGAGWFELEHTAYDIPFYTTGERIRRLDEALEVINRLWTEKQSSFEGRYYKLVDAYCEPKPIRRPRPPLMIGGSGEKLMLRVVAKYADQWNTFGSPEVFRHKINVLREHCAAVGRNFDDIEISWAGSALLTDSPAQKEEAVRRFAAAFGRPPEDIEPGLLIGTPEEVRSRIDQFVEAGVSHFIMIWPGPFEPRSIRRFADEVVSHFRK